MRMDVAQRTAATTWLRPAHPSSVDPNNGQVIAMASYPDYDPAEFTKPIPSDRWAQLNDPNNLVFPLNNCALQGEYAPGSTFNLVTALAGLRHRCHHAGDDDERHRHVPRPRVHRRAVRVQELRRRGPRLGEPCGGRSPCPSDFDFYSLGSQFWSQRSTYGDPIQATAEDLGFDALTGIPLPGRAMVSCTRPTP